MTGARRACNRNMTDDIHRPLWHATHLTDVLPSDCLGQAALTGARSTGDIDAIIASIAVARALPWQGLASESFRHMLDGVVGRCLATREAASTTGAMADALSLAAQFPPHAPGTTR